MLEGSRREGKEMKMKNKSFYLSLLFFAITVGGILSVLSTTDENLGAVVFPSALSLFFFLKSRKTNVKNQSFYFSLLFLALTMFGIIVLVANTRSVDLGSVMILAMLSFFFFVKNKKVALNQ